MRADPAAAAARLAGGPADVFEPVRGAGRNSRVYRLRRGGEAFALKHYPAPARARVECDALQLMARHGVGNVPRVLAADFDEGYALLEWIEGEPVAQPEPGDIDAAAQFLAAMHALRTREGAAAQPLAAEACLSAAEIQRQIEGRLARLG